MKSLESGDSPVRTSVPTSMDGENGEGRSGVVGNERLTALAGAVLLVLILVELVSSASLHAGLAIHIFVGVGLSGPLVVKIGSTFYRFLRYYTRSPAFVRRGPPRLALRVLAPLLIATTLVVIGSGIGLVVTGPRSAGPLLPLHGLSVLVWLPLIAIHVFAYLWRTLRSLADDWSKHPDRSEHLARGLRLGMNLGTLLGGAIAALLVLPFAAPWSTWIATTGNGPGPFLILAGLLVTALAGLIAKLLRWE